MLTIEVFLTPSMPTCCSPSESRDIVRCGRSMCDRWQHFIFELQERRSDWVEWRQRWGCYELWLVLWPVHTDSATWWLPSRVRLHLTNNHQATARNSGNLTSIAPLYKVVCYTKISKWCMDRQQVVLSGLVPGIGRGHRNRLFGVFARLWVSCWQWDVALWG